MFPVNHCSPFLHKLISPSGEGIRSCITLVSLQCPAHGWMYRRVCGNSSWVGEWNSYFTSVPKFLRTLRTFSSFANAASHAGLRATDYCGLLPRWCPRVSLGDGSCVVLLGTVGRVRRWWAGTVKVSPSLLSLIPPSPLTSSSSSLSTLPLTLVLSPCCPCHLSWASWGLSLLSSLVDSVTYGFSRWSWSARVFGCTIFYSLECPFLSPSRRISHILKTQFFGWLLYGVIFNFHRKGLNVQGKFLLICSLQKGGDVTCGAQNCTSITESPFLSRSSSF